MDRTKNILKRYAWLVLIFIAYGWVLEVDSHAQNQSWFEQNSPYEINTRNEVIRIASDLVGIKEATGNNDGPMINVFLASTGLSEGFAWCAASVNWVLEQACANRPLKDAAWSPTWFPANRTYWILGQAEYYKPQPGDVFGIYFSSKNRIAHVGFIESWNGKYANTLEGNTNDAGGREGDGYWRKKRLKKQVSAVSNWIDE